MSDLLKKLKETSFLTGDFITRAGHKTNYYIDKYLFETDPYLLNAITDELIKKLPPINTFDRFAAPELGAVAIASTIAIKIQKPFLIVRKENKQYGTQKLIEGKFNALEKIVVIEDILTTGGAVLNAIKILNSVQLNIVHILAVVNRNEGADENLKAYSYNSLFTRKDF
jgi:orotate phosphoribosyltransferase